MSNGGPTAIARTRRLALEVVADLPADGCPRLVLRAGAGELIVRIDHFAHRVELTAADRAIGAGFVDALARWLGMPLAAAARTGERMPSATLAGSFARRCDDHLLELFVADTEALLYLDSDLARAEFAEKWASHRAQLLRALERTIGLHRSLEQRAPLVLPQVARVTVPRGWVVDRARARAADPTNRVALALAAPPRADDLDLGSCARTHDRGDLAYVEHAAPRRRVLVATAQPEAREAIATFEFPPAAASWALAEWERIVTTLELLSG